MKDYNISFRIDKELADEFDRVATNLGFNKSALMRKWIMDFIEKNKEKEENNNESS